MCGLFSRLVASTLYSCCSYYYYACILILNTAGWASAQVQNVTIQNTDNDLVYIPRLCLGSQVCEGGWAILDLPGSSNGSVTSTNGPSPQTGNILPQVFLTFRGSALYVKTSDVSNATANLTVSSLPSGTLESRVFSPSRDFWAFEDLDASQLTTVALTYLSDSDAEASGSTTRLDIDFVKISVANASVTTSFLPSQTLPTSAFTPSFAPPTTIFSPAATAPLSDDLPIGAIVGGTVGAFLGVLLIVSLIVFFTWRWHRRKSDGEQRKELSGLQAAQQILPVASRRPQLAPINV